MPTGHYVRKVFKPVRERFFSKVVKTDTCWIWTGCRGESGHGQLMVFDKDGKKRMAQAHRISWYLHHGPYIPEGLCVLHKCDVPYCVNPSHLFLGTKQDNTNDMRNKKRMKVGEQLPQTRLNEEKVRYIRRSDKGDSELAFELNVARTTISSVRCNRTWRYVV